MSNTPGPDERSNAEVKDIPIGYRNLKNKPGFCRKVAEILADGQAYTINQITPLLQGTFPDADRNVTAAAIRGLLLRPPPGREIERVKIGNKTQYRMRKTALVSRTVPAELVTNLIEGVKPIVAGLRHWGSQPQHQIPPSALDILAARLEKLFAPLAKIAGGESRSKHVS